MGQDEPGLGTQRRARAAVDRDRVEIARIRARDRQARRSGAVRQAGTVLDPAQALFLDRGDHLAIRQQRRRGVGVVGVQPQDQYHRMRFPKHAPTALLNSLTRHKIL
jgi:hypothetical protein